MPIPSKYIIRRVARAVETAENIYEDVRERKYKHRSYLIYLCLQAYSNCDEARGMLNTLNEIEYHELAAKYGRLGDKIIVLKNRIREAIDEIIDLDT